MRVAWNTLALAGAFLLCASIATAQGPLTLAEALARARERAPQIISARLAIEESRARLLGASHLQSNPEVDLGLGNRQGSGARSTDLDLGLAQSFEPGRRRSARRAMATAGIDQRTAELQEVTRLVLEDTAFAFLRAVHLQDRIRLIDRNAELAGSVLQIADRRFRAGDIPILDVNIARAALARIRADRQRAMAERASAIGELKSLLQSEGELEVQGSLPQPREPDAGALLEAAAGRPELRALEAGIREADAEGQFGQSFRRSDYGFGVRYQREEGDHILFGALTLSLPMFSKGQEPIALGLARGSRLKAELEALRIRARIEVLASLSAHQSRLEVVRLLETEALPGLDDNDTLATRSYEVGQLGLAELLLIRREILDIRFEYLDALLEAALARVQLDARAGVLR